MRTCMYIYVDVRMIADSRLTLTSKNINEHSGYTCKCSIDYTVTAHVDTLPRWYKPKTAAKCHRRYKAGLFIYLFVSVNKNIKANNR